MTQIPDFRSDLAAAQQWVARLMDGVRPDQWDAPTPCSDFDVRALLQHVSSHPAKLAAIADGGNPREMADHAELDENDPGADYLERSTSALGAWADDEVLTRTVIAPWGEAPGGLAVGGFLMETVAHGWDLAVATGQDAEADPTLVAKAQAIADQALTDDNRGPGRPFDHRAEPAAGAGPTDRLAAFLGRTRVTARTS